MAVLLLATQCPAIQVYSGFTSLALAEVSTSPPTPSVLRSLLQGATQWAAKWNRNFTASELLGQYGAGAYGLAYGLGLSTTSGSLALPVGKGHFIMGGPVEVPSDTTTTVLDNETRIYVWLQQDGTFHVVYNSLTPPTGIVGFIGSCVSASGSITSVDTSGILYYKGGRVVRYTADPAAPGDSPPANFHFWTKTQGGEYLWDGTQHILIGERPIIALTTNQVEDATYAQTIITNEGAGGSVQVTLPAAAAGLKRIYIIQAAQTLKVLAAGTNVIRIAGSASSAGGYASANTVGNSLTLEAIDSTNWIATSSEGTWSLA